jgi:DHA3 family tetracycline resistance protein-like MFS transporter
VSVLIAQVIWGFGYTFISGAREAWIADEVGEKNAGAAFIKAGQFAQAGIFVGIALSMVLANIDIRIPIIVAGILYAAQAIFIALFMSENNFVPAATRKRETFRSMKNIFIKGVGLVQKSGVLMTIIAAGAMYGIFSEGFDRLWTPFMLQSFTFPTIGNIKPVVWFGIISMAATLLAVVITESFRRKINSSNHHSAVKALFFVNLLLIVSVVGFALAGNFVAAAALYCGAEALRRVRQPIFSAWANQNVTSSVRATVLSMCSQADAIGQVVGGPILGLIATVVAIKVSLLLAALILTPTLFFYLYSIKNHKIAVDEPSRSAA